MDATKGNELEPPGRADVIDPSRRAVAIALAGLVGTSSTAAANNQSTAPAAPVVLVSGLRRWRPDTATTVVAAGFDAPEDGGAGYFTWLPDATTAADDWIVLAPGDQPGRWQRALPTDGYRDVRWFGAGGADPARNSDAVDAALTSLPAQGGHVHFPAGEYLLARGINLTRSHVTVSGDGANRTLLRMAGDATAEYAIHADGLAHLDVRGLRIDVNQQQRAATLGPKRRACGVVLYSCTDVRITGVTVEHTIGDDLHASGVAIGIGSGSNRRSARCQIVDCVARDCGPDLIRKSDGFFVSGDQIAVTGCVASRATDTGFVIESSTASGLTGCTALDCSAGAAISHADLGRDSSSNYISGLTVHGYDAAVTGGVSINVPVSLKAPTSLRNTVVQGVVILTTSGRGPAVNVRSVSPTNRVIGLTLSNIRVDGAGNQGILIRGEDVLVTNCGVRGARDAGIQIDGSVGVTVQGCTVRAPAGELTGVITDSRNVRVVDSLFEAAGPGTVWGIYLYGTNAGVTIRRNDFVGFAGPGVGADRWTGVTYDGPRPKGPA